MLGRSPVAVMVLTVAVLALSAAPASAQVEGTADQAQARVDFPVYEITRRLGLPAFYKVEVPGSHPGCSGDVQSVRAELRRGKLLRIGRRWISMRQADSGCAVAAVGKRVRRVMIFGRRVTVRRYCAASMIDSCKGQPAERVYTMSFSLRAGSQRTFFAVSASRFSLRAMLRAVRSLRRVDLTRPVVHLTSFRSPDGEFWCGVPGPGGALPGQAFCVGLSPHRHGTVSEDGSVHLCNRAPCLPNFDAEAPKLADGQASAGGPFTCLAQAGAVTCTITEGEHAGKGFRIDASGAVEVSPAPG